MFVIICQNCYFLGKRVCCGKYLTQHEGCSFVVASLCYQECCFQKLPNNYLLICHHHQPVIAQCWVIYLGVCASLFRNVMTAQNTPTLPLPPVPMVSRFKPPILLYRWIIIITICCLLSCYFRYSRCVREKYYNFQALVHWSGSFGNQTNWGSQYKRLDISVSFFAGRDSNDAIAIINIIHSHLSGTAGL